MSSTPSPSPPGGTSSPGELTPQLYAELRGLAARSMARERRDHTLQPTALVHEAFLRLLGQRSQWQSKAHFLAVAAQAMRRILVDHARRRAAVKRPTPRQRVTLTGLPTDDRLADLDLLDLDAALERLGELDPRAVRVVELRGFAGLTVEEASELLGVSAATVARDWRMACAWLRRELQRPPQDAPPEPAARGPRR